MSIEIISLFQAVYCLLLFLGELSTVFYLHFISGWYNYCIEKHIRHSIK